MADSLPATRSRHPVLFGALRITVSVVLLIIVLRQIDFDKDELLPDWNAGTARWLVAAFALTVVAFFLAAVRWRTVLHALGADAPIRRLWSHYMAGQFLSNFVPSTVGGDVLRVSRLGRDTGDPPVSFTSVVFERLSGWLVLPIITFIGFAVNREFLDLGTATRTPILVALITLAALTGIIAVAGSKLVGDTVAGRQGIRRYGAAVHVGIEKLRTEPKRAGEVLVSAFAYQLTLLLAAWCAAEAMEIDPIGPTAIMAFLPAVLTVQVLPIGIGGLGIREGALVLFMKGLDVPEERLLSYGLLLGLLTLLASLGGFWSLLMGGRANTASEMQEELMTAKRQRTV